MTIATEHEAAGRLADRSEGRHPAPTPPKATPKPQKTEKQPPRNDTVVALIDVLGKAQAKLRDHGDVLWQRTVDWQRVRRVAPPSLTEDTDEDTVSKEDAEERLGDALASRYQHEVRTLANRVRTDLARLVQIDAIVVRTQPRHLVGQELLASQVGAEGFCVSCWRNDQRLVEVQKRPNGEPYYRHLCRFCGGWKADTGQIPSLDVIQRRHDGRRITRKAG